MHENTGITRSEFTEKLTRYLNKKSGGNYRCSICKNENFYTMGDGSVNEEELKDYTGPVQKTIGVSCMNCGHIDLFFCKIVLNDKDWE